MVPADDWDGALPRRPASDVDSGASSCAVKTQTSSSSGTDGDVTCGFAVRGVCEIC